MSFVIFCCLGISHTKAQDAEVIGHVPLIDKWKRKVYLCRIPGFNQMHQASDALLIDSTNIDSLGNFHLKFRTDDRESLYRVQLVQQGDPASTIIIGSNDENHAFFVARSLEKISIDSVSASSIISQRGVAGGRSNEQLNALLFLAKNDTIPRDSIKVLMIRLAQSSSELVSLMSIHMMFGLSDGQQEQVRDLVARLDHSNPYGNRIFEEYKSPGFARENWWIVAGVLITILLPLLIVGYRNIRLRKDLRMLSARELDVVRLRIEGKSNKEIAGILNIELSTVKTHVNNCYGKLKVSDLKGLSRYRRFVVYTKGVK